MIRFMLALALTATVATTADAQTLSLPSSSFVNATTSAGTTFTFQNVSTNAVLQFTASGTPTLQSPSIYGTNAAGVVTIAGTSGVGQSSIDPDSGFIFGSLILSLNGADARQAFATTATNGVGSASPPTTFAFSESLADLFGLTAGQTLASAAINFRVDDNLYSDNTGGFTIAGGAQTGGVPEPAIWGTMILGLATAGAALRANRRTASVLA